MSKDVEEYQEEEQEDCPGIKLMEWCREYSRKQIEQIEREVRGSDEYSIKGKTGSST